jgi:hypothetical protein
MSKFQLYLESINEGSVKDLLNKIEDGYDVTDAEIKILVSKGLVTADGKPTQKAKEKFSALYEKYDENHGVFWNVYKVAKKGDSKEWFVKQFESDEEHKAKAYRDACNKKSTTHIFTVKKEK